MPLPVGTAAVWSGCGRAARGEAGPKRDNENRKVGPGEMKAQPLDLRWEDLGCLGTIRRYIRSQGVL